MDEAREAKTDGRPAAADTWPPGGGEAAARVETILGPEIEAPVCCPKNDPLPGAVVAVYRKVGDKTYGPYWSRVWRDEKGRQRRAYVRPEDLEATRLACQAYRLRKRRKGRAHRRASSKWARGFGRAMEALDHMNEAQIRLRHGQKPQSAAHSKVRRLMEILSDAD